MIITGADIITGANIITGTDLARRRAYRRLDHGSTRQNLATARPNLSPETQHFITIFNAAQLKRIDADYNPGKRRR